MEKTQSDEKSRLPYDRPAVVHSETVEARAVTCVKGPSACNPGPAQS